MLHRVVIRTGARLHFGPLSYRPQTGRHFGGVGLMIEEPGGEYQASFNRHGLMVDEAGATEMNVLRRWRETTRREQPAPVQIVTRCAIPSHQGLGSGTQRALAVGEAVSMLTGEREVDAVALARRLGRGNRSAVGIHGYASGGLIVDAGHASGEELGSLACRLEFPSEWAILLITPQTAGGDIAGECELRKFEQLPAMSEAMTGRLCRLLLTEILPAIQSRDCQRLNAALGEYGRTVGEYFAPVQGGVFRSGLIAEVDLALAADQLSAVQSSWGPTAAIVCESSDAAKSLCRRLLERFGPNLSCRITRARNSPRDVELHRHES